MQVLDHICEDRLSVKEGVADAFALENPLSICTHMMWATFRCHDVMIPYTSQGFENHPAISTEYIKFLATNSGFDQVKDLGEKVVDLTEKVKKLTTELAKAISKADTAAGKAAQAEKDVVREHEKRIRKLETSS